MIISPYKYLIFQGKLKQSILLAAGILLLVFFNIGLDFLFTQFHNSAFYISESLLFSSSFWILFFPLLLMLSNYLGKSNKLGYQLLTIGLITLFHLLAYPALVWALSKVFYSHTFAYWQTFNFALNAYLIKTLLIYIFVFLIITISKRKFQANAEEEFIGTNNFLTSIVVSDQHNKKVIINTNDIAYFSASSPYIVIYHQSKKYLHTETLKSLEQQLNRHQFVRVHKSHIINLQKLDSYQSRQNGDYDLTLTDGTILRLSRNYAKEFKSKFHRLSAK